MDSQPNLIDLNTDLSMEPAAVQNIDHQYVNCNGSESISNLNNNDEDNSESKYSMFGAACLSSLSNNNTSINKDPFDMRM